MAAVVGITLVKKFTYRGDATEEFSNQYWLSGSVPASPAAWDTLSDALIAQEKTCYSAAQVIRVYCYDSDDPTADSVYQRDLSAAPVAGTLAITGGMPCAGDAACWVRWKTSRNNTKGKSIYLRKYFHPAFVSSSTGGDTLLGSQKTALQAFGTKMMDGSFAEARTLRSQLHPETLLTSSASTYITTRTLKRRGKRPGS